MAEIRELSQMDSLRLRSTLLVLYDMDDSFPSVSKMLFTECMSIEV